jgi:hypothetical protein
MEYYYIDKVSGDSNGVTFETKENDVGSTSFYLFERNDRMSRIKNLKSGIHDFGDYVLKSEVEFIFLSYYKKHDKIFKRLGILYDYTDIPYE